MKVVRAPFVILLGSLGACGLSANFDGLQGGAFDQAAPPVDAGTPFLRETGAPLATDTGGASSEPLDSTDGLDQGPAPEPESGDESLSFCERADNPVVCSDFDDTNWRQAWDDAVVEPGGSLDVNATLSKSPPSALRVSIRNSYDTPTSAYLVKKVPLTAKMVRAEFDFFRDTREASYRTDVLFFSVVQTDSRHADLTSTNLYEQAGRMAAEVYDGYSQQADRVFELGRVPEPPKWVHYKIEVRLDPASGELRVWADDQQLVNSSGLHTSSQQAAAQEVVFGISGFDAPSNAVYYDNILVQIL